MPGVPPAFVLRVQQELRQLVDGSAGARHMAGDGRGHPVPVLGRTLAISAQGQSPGVRGEATVTAGGVAAGEIAEQD